MDLIICGIEKDIPYDYQGHKGVTNRFYVMDKEPTTRSRENGSSFVGQRTEFIKVPKSVNIDDFGLADVIRVYYNRYGQVDYIEKVN